MAKCYLIAYGPESTDTLQRKTAYFKPLPGFVESGALVTVDTPVRPSVGDILATADSDDLPAADQPQRYIIGNVGYKKFKAAVAEHELEDLLG